MFKLPFSGKLCELSAAVLRSIVGNKYIRYAMATELTFEELYDVARSCAFLLANFYEI